jgi:hypothetical protein
LATPPGGSGRKPLLGAPDDGAPDDGAPVDGGAPRLVDDATFGGAAAPAADWGGFVPATEVLVVPAARTVESLSEIAALPKIGAVSLQ